MPLHLEFRRPYTSRREPTILEKGLICQSTNDGTMRLEQVDTLSCSETVIVYRGTLIGSDNSQIPVVCKLGVSPAGNEVLKKELEVYEKMIEIQGIHVPKIYFVFEGQTYDCDHACCILMEDCGDSVYSELDELSLPLKLEVYDAYHAIHKLGVVHGDAGSGNTIIDKGNHVRIIDFTAAYFEECSVCKGGQDFLPGDPEPDPEDFRCNELLDVCRELDYWKQTHFYIYGHSVPIETALDMDKLLAFAGPHLSRERAMEIAKETIMDYLKIWDPKQYDELMMDEKPGRPSQEIAKASKTAAGMN